MRFYMSSIWVQLKSHLRWCCAVVLPEVTWPEVRSVAWPKVILSGSRFCAYATGNCAISALVGPFDRRWQSHVTRRGPARKCSWRKYVLRMRNLKLRHIHPSVAFWPEVTMSRDRKKPYPEVYLTGSRFCACPGFSRAFFFVVVTWLPDVTEGHLTPFRCSLGCTQPEVAQHP
jgi:hypothetical protein